MGKSKKKRFDVIKNKVQNARDNNLQARQNRGSLINFDKSNKLLQDIEHSKVTYEEALKRIILAVILQKLLIRRVLT